MPTGTINRRNRHSFQDRERPTALLASDDGGYSAGAHASVAPSSITPPIAKVPSSKLVTVYGMFLVVLILAYFAGLIYVTVELLNLTGLISLNLWAPAGMWAVNVIVTAVLLFFVTRLAAHMWRMLTGLVTQRYDVVPETNEGVLLTADLYPKLYAVVAEVGKMVHAPTPDEIRLTHRPDCYVVELRSFAIQTDRRLVLVIGMPQMEVMTQAELKVIIAHELAHFAGGDTRLSVFVFRFLEALRQAQQDTAGRIWRWVDPVTWASWSYFHLFFVLSSPIRKHQELRADGWSALVFGGEFAASTLLKDWHLERKFDEAIARYLHTLPRINAPAPNIFRDFAMQFHDLTPEGQGYLEKRLSEEEQGSFWDSHPTLQERMRNMRRYPDRQQSEPIPARLLLPDFEGLEFSLQADCEQD